MTHPPSESPLPDTAQAGDGTPETVEATPASPHPAPAPHAAAHAELRPAARRWAAGPPWPAAAIGAVALLGSGILLGLGIGSSGTAAPAAGVGTPTPAVGSASAAGPTPAAPTTASPGTAPTPATAAPTTAAVVTRPASTSKPTYRTLSPREWKLVAKNPDAYVGRTYVVYGVVTQFDAATGDDTFRADVGPRNMAEVWDYETNTLLTGDAERLRDVVEDDEFRAEVTVLGSFSYDTQIGGNTTVPLLRIDRIRIL